MNREETKKLLEREEELRPIKQAFVDGADVQYLSNYNKWITSINLSWVHPPEQYRVKPNPRVVYHYEDEKGRLLLSWDAEIDDSNSLKPIKFIEDMDD